MRVMAFLWVLVIANWWLPLEGRNCQWALNATSSQSSLATWLAESPYARLPPDYFYDVLHSDVSKQEVFTFGIEGEFNSQSHPKMLQFYRPADLNVNEWQAMNSDQKFEWAGRYEKANHLMTKGSKAYVLNEVNLVGEFLDDFLPHRLDFEGNGSVEINGKVYRTLFELYFGLSEHAQLFDPLYFQAHVAWPRNKLEGMAGYTLFSSDYFQLEALERGWSLRKSVSPAKNFLHSSLGPISDSDSKRYQAMETKMLSGEKMGHGSGSRVVYATVPRDDVYPPGVVGFELRTHNKRWKDLFEEAVFLTLLVEQRQLSEFKQFDSTPVLEDETFEQYLKLHNKQELWTRHHREFFYSMKQEFTSKVSRNIGWGGADPSIRFYWPFRNWQLHPIWNSVSQIEQTKAFDRIEMATNKFLEALIQLGAEEFEAKTSLTKWQLAVAEWAYDADIGQYFKSFRQNEIDRLVWLKTKGAEPLKKF